MKRKGDLDRTHQPPGDYVIHSFRVTRDLDKYLRAEAEKQARSISSLVAYNDTILP